MSLFSLSLPKASMGMATKGDAERWNSFLTLAELFVFGNSCFLLFIMLSAFLTMYQIALIKGGNTFSVPEEVFSGEERFIFLKALCMEVMNKAQNATKDLYNHANAHRFNKLYTNVLYFL